MGAGHCVFLLPLQTTVLVVTSHGVYSQWDFAFPYLDSNGELPAKDPSNNRKGTIDKVSELTLSRQKLDELRRVYALGTLHRENTAYYARGAGLIYMNTA